MAPDADVADVLAEPEIMPSPPKYNRQVVAKAVVAISLVALTALALVLMTRTSGQTSVESDVLLNLNEGAYMNVLGGQLQTCSKPGMALTGFTRDGHCIDSGDDDQGSHHICIQMKKNFCTVTGQPNWCESKMECMGQAGKCPIGNWCVCQWAFATYLGMAGGCDQIVELQCNATNMAALKAYRNSTAKTHKEALACINSRCGIQ